MDDTLAEINEPMINLMNSIKHTHYTPKDADSWSWIEKTFKTDFYFIYNATWKHHGQIKPLVGQEKMREFTSLYDTDLTSLRPLDTVPYLARWLSSNFPGLVPDKARLTISGAKDGKAGLPYDIYIDDHPALAEQIEKKEGKLLYLVRYRYNEHIQKSEKVIPVRNAAEAVDHLISLAKGREHKLRSLA